MARILYGVAGQGFGHSSRSEVIGRRLIESGHEVLFGASCKSLSYLQSMFHNQVHGLHGLRLVYHNGRTKYVRTLWQNLATYTKGLATNHRFFCDRVSSFKPDLVITDFEPFCARWAWQNHVPCLNIDHQHLLTLCNLENDLSRSADFWVTNTIIKSYNPYANAYIIPNFFEAVVKKNTARLVPPVIRPILTQFKPELGDAILVYSTDSGKTCQDKIQICLGTIREQRFVIYGFNVNKIVHNCVFKKTSTETFLQDLSCCRGVISSAGFSLIGECLYFGKGMLLVPITGQYEQKINAYYAEKLGLAMCAEEFNPWIIRAFLRKIESPASHKSGILRPDNSRLFTVLDRVSSQIGITLSTARIECHTNAQGAKNHLA